MEITINGKSLIEALMKSHGIERGPVNLYLSKELYVEFKQKCGELPMSVVLEELIRAFIETAPSSGVTSRKRKAGKT